MSDLIVQQLQKEFNEHFGKPAFIVRSPGRINLIGEHTDYNLGYVLPAAIDKAIYIGISARADAEIHLIAKDIGESFVTKLDAINYSKLEWPNYLLGVVEQFQKKGLPLTGFNAVVSGDVPLGAGLSSSAAVECAITFALNTLLSTQLSRLEMVKLAQKAENEFVGVQCGIMDQFASMFGKKESVIRLDCRSLDYEYMPFDIVDFQIVLMDTGVKHSLAATAYNQRRLECEAGVSMISKYYDGINSLRDVTIAMVEKHLSEADQNVYHRCKFIVEEISRLQLACEDLLHNDMISFGQKMFATHEGLSKLYEVSCTEADVLVNAVINQPAVIGARMMGGGFGGCTINLVKRDQVAEVIADTSAIFFNTFQRPLTTYLVNIDEGTSII
jgi:galactokinase